MVKKKSAKSNKRKVSRTMSACKNNILRKKADVMLGKSSQSKLVQLNNYKAFLKCLLSKDLENELADES